MPGIITVLYVRLNGCVSDQVVSNVGAPQTLIYNIGEEMEVVEK